MTGVAIRRVAVEVRGTVQGVGYRPFVATLARRLGLAGDVANVGGRVVLDVEGAPSEVAALLVALTAEAPAAARITAVEARDAPPRHVVGFHVRPSTDDDGPAFVAADRAPCAACEREVDDPTARRHGYPFATCNACGPRWTVITGAPYERARTTMAELPPCAACRAELADPGGRHFLAETIACPACGPRLLWEGPGGESTDGDPIRRAVAALRAGAIVAVKGVGGYHLACDARDASAVGRLRAGKARDAKPFAVLVTDEEAAGALAHLDPVERETLRGPARPIVLARRRDEANPLAPQVAPDSPWLGLLLPPSLLHRALARAFGGPLVLTSGNRSDEPMPIDAGAARERLAGIADAFLHHDRAIVLRVDDSVVRVVNGAVVLLRRARGIAPEPIRLPIPVPEPVLALGGDLKAAFAVAIGDLALVSHHLGDLGDVETTTDLERAIEHVERLLGARPRIVAHDLHPDQESTRLATALAAQRGGRVVPTAHHHAHVASCLADAGRDEPVIGVALDGLGLGPDGTWWGGEILVGDVARLERVAHLRPVAVPGGDAASRAPWRVAVAHLLDADLPTGRLARFAPAADIRRVEELVRAGRAPAASSTGRLFDAVACLVGLRGTCSFEGQAAIALEGAAVGSDDRGAHPLPLRAVAVRDTTRWEIDSRPLIRAVVDDVDAGVAVGAIAARFHRGLTHAIVEVAERVRAGGGPSTVALAGGVFANAVLLSACEEVLVRRGFAVLRPARVPPNDGGLALGQLHLVAARTRGA